MGCIDLPYKLLSNETSKCLIKSMITSPKIFSSRPSQKKTHNQLENYALKKLYNQLENKCKGCIFYVKYM
ncbi:hypothetical protein PAHAL_5G358900 [Panicum hallii]|uniref:Uncharacterized protein n=1 Tax=Panicum hallii TaxID=206008 RepID=A0A2S3HVP6_9POAL|nr:hypothetical protein PAHAL_5G358900 [Panicum hallii]